MESPRTLAERYLHLTDDGVAERYEANTDFWSRIDELPPAQGGWLVSSFDIDADMDHWELHPEGDEVFVLVRGEIDVVLELDDAASTVRLRRGRSFVIPRGAWHRWEVREPGTLVVCTFGRGTQHRPRR